MFKGVKHHKTLYTYAKYVKHCFNLANKYFKFLGKRSKVKEQKEDKIYCRKKYFYL